VNDVFPSSFSERVRNLNRYSGFNFARSAAARLLLDGPSALRGWLLRTLISPGADIGALTAAREALTDWVKSRATPFYHPSGTCRMGNSHDRSAVVDGLGRVHGIANLRVADASVMPMVTRAATNLTSIMIGEKMAAHIKAR
jgi:5-(hydroxymethyl)furfural/furfural oxidase